MAIGGRYGGLRLHPEIPIKTIAQIEEDRREAERIKYINSDVGKAEIFYGRLAKKNAKFAIRCKEMGWHK